MMGKPGGVSSRRSAGGDATTTSFLETFTPRGLGPVGRPPPASHDRNVSLAVRSRWLPPVQLQHLLGERGQKVLAVDGERADVQHWRVGGELLENRAAACIPHLQVRRDRHVGSEKIIGTVP